MRFLPPSISEVAYHPYYALISHLDHSEAIRLERKAGGTFSTAAKKLFSKDCLNLRDEIAATLKAYEASLGKYESPPPRLPSYLFRPLCFGALGHSDDLAIVLLDDLPQALRLTAGNQSVEDSDIAFCPTLDSLKWSPAQDLHDKQIISRTLNPRWPFVELHTLITDGLAFKTESLDWSKKESLPAPLWPTPLLTLSNFKLNLLTSLGHASVLYQLVIETLCETVRRACGALLDDNGKAYSDLHPYIQTQDILELKCAILEPQSAEDIALLIFCKNYALAGIIIAALRAMTIDDVLAFDLEYHGRLLAMTLTDPHFGKLHPTIIDRTRLSSDPDDDLLFGIRENHVFMTSYSTLGVSYYAVENPIEAKVSGFVEAYTSMDMSPGHEAHLRSRLQGELAHTLAAPHDVSIPPDIDQCTLRIVPGQHDELLNPSASDRGFRAGAAIQTADYFHFLHRCFNCPVEAKSPSLSQGKSGNIESGSIDNAARETGFLDIASTLVIRIPKSHSQFQQDAKSPPITSPNHRHGLELFKRLSDNVRGKLGMGQGRDLQRELREEIRLPTSWLYPISYLFEEFFMCLKDPLRCDAVLDIYDCFVALDLLIRKEYKAYLQELPAENAHLLFLKATELFVRPGLKEFVEGLQHSFSLRLQRSIPHHEVRDTTFSLRGGFAKFMSAMDVALKCSMGWFRRTFLVENILTYNERTFRQRFAGITYLGVREKASVQFCTFSRRRVDLDNQRPCTASPEDYPVYLAAISMDVLNLFNPEQIILFLHEVAHLYFQTYTVRLLRQGISESDTCAMGVDVADDQRKMQVRLSEVFAELMTHLLVFEGDSELFARHYAIKFSQQQAYVFDADAELSEALNKMAAAHEASSPNDVEVEQVAQCLREGFLESAFRLFLVIDLVKFARVVEEKLPVSHPVYTSASTDEDVDGACERFIFLLRSVAPFYKDLHSFFGPGVKDTENALKWFRSNYTRTIRKAAGIIWESAAAGMNSFLNAKSAETKDIIPDDLGKLDSDLWHCLNEGRAFRRMYWARDDAPGKFQSVDPLLVASRLAYMYIKRTYGHLDPEKRIFVDSGPTHAAVKESNALLIHPVEGSVVCCDPELRQARLLQQIACFKTLWDISSHLRARRFVELLSLPDVATD